MPTHVPYPSTTPPCHPYTHTAPQPHTSTPLHTYICIPIPNHTPYPYQWGMPGQTHTRAARGSPSSCSLAGGIGSPALILLYIFGPVTCTWAGFRARYSPHVHILGRFTCWQCEAQGHGQCEAEGYGQCEAEGYGQCEAQGYGQASEQGTANMSGVGLGAGLRLGCGCGSGSRSDSHTR